MKKDKFNVSFRRQPAATGLYAVGHSTPSVDVKVNKKVVGYIKAPAWNTPDGKWCSFIAFKKQDINSDGNPNCEWSWWKVGGRYDREDEARLYLKENLERITNERGLTLHYFDDGDL